MDAKLKADWIAALRSNKFKQTKGRLKDERGYCCLGVLCVVAGLPLGDDGVLRDDLGLDVDYAPLRELGISDLAPLYTRNDNGVPFPEIAKFIEAYVPADDAAGSGLRWCHDRI